MMFGGDFNHPLQNLSVPSRSGAKLVCDTSSQEPFYCSSVKGDENFAQGNLVLNLTFALYVHFRKQWSDLNVCFVFDCGCLTQQLFLGPCVSFCFLLIALKWEELSRWVFLQTSIHQFAGSLSLKLDQTTATPVWWRKLSGCLSIML